MFSSACANKSVDASEICILNLYLCIAAVITIIVSVTGIVYFMFINRVKTICDELFYCHNIRSGCGLFLIIVNIWEIAESVISNWPPLTTSSVILVPEFSRLSSSLSIVAFIVFLGFVRIIEIRDKPDWLYLVIVLEAILYIPRLCKLIKLSEFQEVYELQSFLITISTILLLILAVTDVYTIIKESRSSKRVRRAVLPSSNVGYKHPHATFLSKITFWWLTPLLWKGFWNPLELHDLGNLYEKNTSRFQYDQFLFIYQSFKNKRIPLWLCYFKSCWKMFIAGGILKLFGDLVNLVGPLSISHIVEYIQNKNTNGSEVIGDSSNSNNYNHSANTNVAATSSVSIDGVVYHPTWMDFISNGWIFSVIVLMSSLAQATLSQGSTHMVNMVGIRLKTAIQGLVYRKTLMLSSSCFYKEFSDESSKGGGYSSNPDSPYPDGGDCGKIEAKDSEEAHVLKQRKGNERNGNGDNANGSRNNMRSSRTDAGTITNLMSDDALNIMTFFWIGHYVWAIPLKIGLIMYLLYQKLGVSAIIGALFCILIMTPIQFLIGKKMSSNAKAASEHTDERLKKLNEVLLGIKLIKLNAWEKVFKERIQKTREKELRLLDKDSIYWAAMTILTHVSSVMVTFVTLFVFTRIDDGGSEYDFTAGRLFSALALFNQLTVALFIFPITIPIIIGAIVSTRRLERFLELPEVKKELEGVQNMARVLCRSDASLDIFEYGKTNVVAASATTPTSPPINKPVTSQEIIDNANSVSTNFINENDEVDSLAINDNSISILINNSRETSTILAADGITEGGGVNDVARDGGGCGDNTASSNNDLSSSSLMTKGADSESRLKYSASIVNSKIKLKKKNQLSMSVKAERNRHRNKSWSSDGKDFSQLTLSKNVVVDIQNAKFSWFGGSRETHSRESDGTKSNFITSSSFGAGTNAVLYVNKLKIPKGKLTIIIGKNGAGKSSLLAALLKEMNLLSGDVLWNKYSTTAYVPQEPWLLNSTIRDNILFGESYRPKRYDIVLESCALKPDIQLMPGGDMTEIGERGINLSGGQRQRIAIARALYSSANVVIMDDALSALDNEVGNLIIENCIKKMLIDYKRTTILVTQKINLITIADYIVAVENNSIRASGSLAEIENNDPKLLSEWNAIIAIENAKQIPLSPGRTARERWKLFKNVSRIGLQQRTNATEEDELSASQTLFISAKRRSSLLGSRHLTCDIPLSIDEYHGQDINLTRRPSRRSNFSATHDYDSHSNVLRANSLQAVVSKERLPVIRNVSSPSGLGYGRQTTRLIDSTATTENGKNGWRQILRRMSSRRRSSLVGDIYRERKRSRPISASNSLRNKDIDEEESHIPIQKMISTVSKCSEETEDEIASCMDYNEEISDRLISDEERKYGKIPMKIYTLYLRSCGLYTVTVFFLSAFGWQALRVYTDVWLREWTDNSSGATTTEKEEIIYYFKIYGILSVMCIVLSFISTPAGQYAGCCARRTIHDKLLDSILKNSLHFFQVTPVGRLLNRFSNDMSVIDKKIAATSQRLLQFIMLCLCAILINTVITPWFILLTLPICGLYYIIQKFYRSSSRELQRIESITKSPIISHFSETIQGVTTIRAFNQESRFMEILFKRMEANTVAFIILNTSNRWLGIALDYLGGIVVFIAIITALFTSHLYPDNTKPSLIGLAINYTLLVPIYLNWVVILLSDMEMYIGAVERVHYYIESENRPKSLIYKTVPISWPQKGDIMFEDVSLRYENQKENVISNLNLTIPAGQRIGICGRTGSGKSSLALSIFRVLNITGGRILIDDIDISSINVDELRSRLSIIPQDVVLFKGTVRENLDPRGHYSDLDLWNCLETAQLKDAIKRTGLDSEILEGGVNLSSGRRQLFCLARAVLRGSACLILDEATSSLDSQTERELIEAADKAFEGRTIITIAHRLSTILDYDRVIVMENGRIVEDGDPRILKNKSSGKFYGMLKLSTQHITT